MDLLFLHPIILLIKHQGLLTEVLRGFQGKMVEETLSHGLM